MTDEPRSALSSISPYAAFGALVAVYSWFTLGQGFNASDEGYLLSLGQRVLDGETPYRDFYFLRTPGSVYIQSLFMAVFGDGYTVLASRIVWLIETALGAAALSLIYRRYVNAVETFLLLLTTYVCTTIILNFPWYNYDAAFFGILAAVALFHRKYLLVGLAAFLAFWCKQSYLALLPGYLIIALLIQWRGKGARLIDAAAVIRMVIGFGAPAAAYGIYLGATGALGAFWDNVFVFPQKASQTTLGFALFQDHPDAFLPALPAVAAVVVWFFFRRSERILWVFGGLAGAGAVVAMFWSHHYFVYSLIYTVLAVAALTLVQILRGEAIPAGEPLKSLVPVTVIGVILVYLAGLNYGGVVLAYAGTGVAIIIAYLLFRDVSPSPISRRTAIAMLLLLLAGGAFWKYAHVYRDMPRSELQSEFRVGKLEGITSHRRNTWQIEQMVNAVKERTDPGDYIFVFPDFPILYYLTDRRNPTPIPWYIQVEYGGPMTTRALESLREHPPRLIFLQTYFEIDFARAGALIDYETIPRFAPFFDFITTYYERETTLGDVHLFVPKGSGRSEG